jgi:hypothetical protein
LKAIIINGFFQTPETTNPNLAKQEPTLMYVCMYPQVQNFLKREDFVDDA